MRIKPEVGMIVWLSREYTQSVDQLERIIRINEFDIWFQDDKGNESHLDMDEWDEFLSKGNIKIKYTAIDLEDDDNQWFC